MRANLEILQRVRSQESSFRCDHTTNRDPKPVPDYVTPPTAGGLSPPNVVILRQSTRRSLRGRYGRQLTGDGETIRNMATCTATVG